jgi:hypothetical protein
MRSRILPAVGISALALVAAAAFAPGASATHGVSPAHKSPVGTLSHAKPLAACVAQNDNDNGIGIVSQNFEPTNDAFDAQGADDFKLKKTCKLKTTTVSGAYFNGAGPADSLNVTFYKNSGGLPGAIVKDFQGTSYTDGSGTGNFTAKTKGKLKKGKYFVSVQVNMTFGVGGEWGWNTNNTVRGVDAVWQNPGDGFATGCTSYTTMTTCIVAGEGGDDSFQLN